MAEILGVLPTAIELVICIYKAAEKVHGLVHEGRHADENVALLFTELRQMQWFLNSCEGVLVPILSSRIQGSIHQQQLEAAKAGLKDLECMLQEVKQPGGDVRKWRWIQRSSKCKQLALKICESREKLKDCILMLQFQMCDHILRSDPQRAHEFYSAIRMDQEHQQVLTVSYNNDRHSRSSSVSSAPPSSRVTTGSSTLLLSTSPLVRPVAGPRTLQDAQCETDCKCTCHNARIRRNSAPFFRASLSPADHRLGTFAFSRQCSLPDCCSSRRGRAEVIASYPSHLFGRLLTVSLLYQGLKFSMRLNTTPWVPEYSDVVRAALNGDLGWLQKIFSSKLGSPNDTSLDGWSLLHTAAYNCRLEVVNFLLREGAHTEVHELKNRTPFHFAMIKSLKADATDEERQIADVLWQRSDSELSMNAKFREEFRLTPVHACVLHLFDNQDEQPDLTELLELISQMKNNKHDRNWDQLKKKYHQRSPLFTEIIEQFETYYRQQSQGSRKGELDTPEPIDQGDINGWTPLHWAAYVGRFEELKILLEFSANPLLITSSRRNVFHHAAESGHAQMMEHLSRQPFIQANVKVNLQDLWGETPLHIAVARSAGSVKALLDLNATVTLKQADDRNPLHDAYLATEENDNRYDIVRRLCDRDSSIVHVVDAAGKTPVFELLNDSRCVALLIEHKAKLDLHDKQKRNLLHYACKTGNPEVLKTLLSRLKPRTFKLVKMVTALDTLGSTPLREAFLSDSALCVLQLLSLSVAPLNAFIGPDGWNVLHHAARLGSCEVVETVLNSRRWERSELLRRTNDGKTAEQIARDAGHYEGRFQELLDSVKIEQQRVESLAYFASLR